jgi:hypothetical protein
MIGAPAIQFKGSGWYVTDYAAKKSSANESGSAEKSATGDGPKDAAKEPKKESGAKEAKEKKSAKKE